MKYAVAMGSVAMIYVPSFVDIGSDIQNLTERVKESRLKRNGG
jgi:hypothetical protein